ncbi:hypothetical protein [Novosphingobium sp. FKTRR1]|uniref:hypothetical protein n=1 Tax=Novosphingobium sp. FKTRR1 TaxID=2879118 RepID=UPI001CF05A90|nr:hypothetical protein [Novosphingobium sp. FKTRR1]
MKLKNAPLSSQKRMSLPFTATGTLARKPSITTGSLSINAALHDEDLAGDAAACPDVSPGAGVASAAHAGIGWATTPTSKPIKEVRLEITGKRRRISMIIKLSFHGLSEIVENRAVDRQRLFAPI